MLVNVLQRIGLRSSLLHGAGLVSIGLCLALWAQAKTTGGERRANAERRAIFVGLWTPTLLVLGNSLEQAERR